MMALSSVLGVCFTTIGLFLSYFWNLTSGATIILVSGVAYLLALGLRSMARLSAKGSMESDAITTA